MGQLLCYGGRIMRRATLRNSVQATKLSLIASAGIALAMTAGCGSSTATVEQFGEMRQVLGGDAADAKSRVALAKVLDTPHAYAVGALPQLQGEITIIDGQAWIAQPMGNGELQVDGPSAHSSAGAAMLTVAHVEQWDEINIETALGDEALEDFIAERARNAGVELERPFPFVIAGTATDLQTHVVNGACPMKPGARLAAEQQPWRHQLSATGMAKVVGFYAADSVGKLTHPGTSVHAHAVFEANGQTVTAHVERMKFAPDAKLYLPIVE
jgi:acetolactate decarboxylase